MDTQTRTSSERKLYAVNAGYRPSDINRLWYYVFACDNREAKRRFAETITWLAVYRVCEVPAEQAKRIIQHPEKFIVIG